MLGEFTGEDETNRSLNLTGGNGRFLGIRSEFGSFRRDTFEDVVYEGVEDRHCFVGDTSIGMDLLQHWRRS